MYLRLFDEHDELFRLFEKLFEKVFLDDTQCIHFFLFGTNCIFVFFDYASSFLALLHFIGFLV